MYKIEQFVLKANFKNFTQALFVFERIQEKLTKFKELNKQIKFERNILKFK